MYLEVFQLVLFCYIKIRLKVIYSIKKKQNFKFVTI